MIKIKWSGYKYAPESVKITANGQQINPDAQQIKNLICCGKKADAIQAIKREYRKETRKECKYTYAFFAEGSRQYYYIPELYYTAGAGLDERFFFYKRLKNHLQQHKIEITTESGYITPEGSTAPEVKTEYVKIDFSRILKLKIA